MKNPHKLLLASAASAAILVGGAFTQNALAADSSDNPKNSLIAALATKFNINQSEVEQVFAEHRQEMEAVKTKKVEERLDQAVADGDLTAAQKELIIAKQGEIKEKMNAAMEAKAEGTSPKEAMKEVRTELEAWATENGIDTKWIMPMGGHRGGPGGHEKSMR
ncbi:MAG: hypothetical protein K0S20_583 [Patescibacteria group bacterium]|jgi:hypothetical protein|nr:hypothetical protein [Patescibacteria group bacterium]